MTVSFSSTEDAAAVSEFCTQNVSDLRFISQIAAGAFGCLAISRPVPNSTLNDEELIFLRILQTKDNPQKVFSSLKSVTSVNAVHQSILKKLGVSTILQAVALASLYQWSDEVPYVISEVSFVSDDLDDGPD